MGSVLPVGSRERALGWVEGAGGDEPRAEASSSKTVTLIVDDGGYFGRFNACAYTLLGCNSVISGERLNILDFISHNDRRRAASQLGESINQGGGRAGSFTFHRNDGTSFEAEVSTEPCLSAGRTVGVILSLSVSDA
jgi:hypothetical protein